MIRPEKDLATPPGQWVNPDIGILQPVQPLTNCRRAKIINGVGLGNCGCLEVCRQAALAQPVQPVSKKNKPRIDLGRYAGTYGGYTKEQS